MKWFEHEKNIAAGFKLKPPYDRIIIGCDPRDGMTKETADSFDVYINVSDSICTTFEPSRPGQFMHWYPVNECGLWNLSYLYWLKTVMDFHYDAGHRIYLHCHAGAYRSPSAALLWLQSRGISPRNALKICKDRGPSIYRIWQGNGNIPKLKDFVFAQMRKYPTWSLASILLQDAPRAEHAWNREVLNGDSRTCCLTHHYFWFYYKPKWWFKEKIREFEYWAIKKYGWKRSKYCTSYYVREHFWAWGENAEPKYDPYYDYDIWALDPKNGRDPYEA